MAKKLHFGKWSLGTLAMAAVGIAAAPVVTPPGPQETPKKQALVTTKELGGTERFLSYVATDKPIYRANEKVYVRAVLLDAATHKPLGDDKQVYGEVQILGPKGETITSGGAQSENSVIGYAWTVPAEAAGGEYTFKIKYPGAGYAPAERKFDVRIYRAPRLKNQVTFAREGYGPGDKVTASVHSERAEGGIPAGAKVTVIARVDDRQVWSGPATIDAKGDATATFELPKNIERGEGTLAFAIEDGGVVETASKTIPILLQTLDLNIYPEGGDAVAGVANRFYFEAKTPAKKPADFVGAVFDSKGNKVADVKTEHEGRGRFEFTPAQGEKYVLKVAEPAGITKAWTLPEAKNDGVVIRVGEDVVPNVPGTARPISITLHGKNVRDGGYRVTLTKREVDVADAPLSIGGAANNPNMLAYPILPRGDVDGVLTLTVWNGKGEPVAERLVYRPPAKQIKVSVKADQSTYTPGGKVKLDINTTDENGKPLPSIVGLTVTDDSVLEMIEKREQAPRLPVMVMLEGEVKDLADAHVYMDASNPKAALATDLLLGTQGWRRFATVRAEEFLAEHGDAARRVLAAVKPEPQAMDMLAMQGGFGGGQGRGGAVRLMAVPMAAAEKAVRDADGDEVAAMGVLRENVDAFAPAVEEKADREPAGPPVAKQLAAEMAADEAPAGGRGGRAGFARRMAAPPQNFVVVREYAHELRPNWTPGQRVDFTETLYWNAGIKTDDNGHATASFALSDAVTSFRLTADAFSKVGSFGTSSAEKIESVQAFFIEPKLPLEVTAGDVIELPISIRNNTAEALGNLQLTVKGGEGLKIVDPNENKDRDTTLAAKQGLRRMVKVTVGEVTGDINLSFDASAGAFSDHVTRTLRVKPKGFPTSLAFGGLLDAATPAKKQFMVPNSVVPNSMKASLVVYPSPAANLTDAVAALLQEPNGCFEQTSSTAYPLAMAQDYFMKHQGIEPALVARGAELLARGYQKLIAFECKDKGYEWFGGEAPGHEALTAYGLMEFRDMKNAGMAVDEKMIERTRTWLISRANDQGGFERNARALDSFGGAPELTTNAYIVWALLQAGETPTTLSKQIAAVKEKAKSSADSYVLALAANICHMTKDAEGARYFMNAVAKKQNKSGAVDGAETSITRSGGEALAIETTALATLAWLNDKEFAGPTQNSIKFLSDSCKGGRFGSTQSTILALKAIVAYDQAMAHPKAPGNLTLLIDNKVWGEPITFTAETKGTLAFPDFAAQLAPGPHTVDLRMADGSQMPFSLEVLYNSITPAADKQCKLGLVTTLKDAQMTEGGITEQRVEVTNRTDKDAASPVAIVGIPGGLEPRHDQLKELVKAGKIDAYEVRGREVILYWRQIKAGVKQELSLSLTAGVPGEYTAPASRVYEYYTDEFKQWIDGNSVTIQAK